MGITIIGLLLAVSTAIFFGVKKMPIVAVTLAFLFSTLPFVLAFVEFEQYGETELFSTFELNGVVAFSSDEYAIWDDECMYLIREGKVVLYDDDDVERAFEAEVVVGNYENLYAEVYLTKVENTFLSIGGYYIKSYKFYVPEKIVTE